MNMALIQKHKLITLVFFIIILGSIFFVLAYFNPSQNIFFYSCPIQKTTGYLCAGCGVQRALHQLLHFNFLEAFRLNPLFVVSLPFFLFGVGVKVWNYIYNRKYRFPLFSNNKFIICYIIVVFLFAILRNIPTSN